MSRLSFLRLQGQALCAVALTISSAAVASAQDGPPPPPPPPFGGPGGGPRGFRPLGPPPPVSAATVPVSLLTAGLALSDTQETTIRGILDKLRDDRRAMMPRFGGPGGGGSGRDFGQEGTPPPSFEAMQANMVKVRALEKKAAEKVEALLSSEQKTKLTVLLSDASLLRDAGLPMEVAPDLKLTDEQRIRLKALAPPKPGANGGDNGMPPPRREQSTARAMAILGSAQRVIVQKFIRENPRPQFGGPGDRPGGPGGRPGRPGGFGGGPGGGPGREPGGRGPGGPQGPPPPLLGGI